MPNFQVGTVNGSVPSQAGVGTVSTIIVPDNPSRTGLIVTNISSSTIYLGFGNTATVSAGVVLTANGGAWSMDEYSYSKQAITAIAHSSTLVIAIQEFVNIT